MITLQVGKLRVVPHTLPRILPVFTPAPCILPTAHHGKNKQTVTTQLTKQSIRHTITGCDELTGSRLNSMCPGLFISLGEVLLIHTGIFTGLSNLCRDGVRQRRDGRRSDG